MKLLPEWRDLIRDDSRESVRGVRVSLVIDLRCIIGLDHLFANNNFPEQMPLIMGCHFV